MSAATLSPNSSETATADTQAFIRAPRRGAMRRPYRWTVANYHRAIEAGVFDEDPHVELIEGELIRTMSENPPHVTALKLVGIVLARVFHLEDAHVSSQHPITIQPQSEPEPDVAVLRGGVRDYSTRHPEPADVLLLVEISDSTLSFDRNRKARIYARAGIAEYWILNVNARTLEVYRNPQTGVYPAPIIYDETQMVLPLNAPTTTALIAVADLLP